MFNSSVTIPVETFLMGTPIRSFRTLVPASALNRPFPLRLSDELKGAQQKGQRPDTYNNYFRHIHLLNLTRCFFRY